MKPQTKKIASNMEEDYTTAIIFQICGVVLGPRPNPPDIKCQEYTFLTDFSPRLLNQSRKERTLRSALTLNVQTNAFSHEANTNAYRLCTVAASYLTRHVSPIRNRTIEDSSMAHTLRERKKECEYVNRYYKKQR